MFLEGFFLRFVSSGVRNNDELALPMGRGKTSPISAVDVARVVTSILAGPAPHIGKIYDLTGPESADLDHYANAYSEALGRTIRYRDVSADTWRQKLIDGGLPPHLIAHVTAMAELNRQGRYDRMTDAVLRLTGQSPVSVGAFVKQHAARFTDRIATS